MRRVVSGYIILLRVMGLVIALVLLVACGPAATPAPTAPMPEPGAEWDYVALGDSTPAGYGVQKSYVDIYAEYIEADLGVTVRVHNWARGGKSAAGLLTALQGVEALRGDIREAEVITIWIGANDILPCVGVYPGGGKCGKWEELDMDCVREEVTALKANIDAVIAEILSLRSPDETLILIADVGNPLASQWKELGLLDELKGPVMEDWINHIAQAAEKNNLYVVHTYRVINGPNGDNEGAPPDISQADGVHFNEEGHRLLADLHREVGYAPFGP